MNKFKINQLILQIADFVLPDTLNTIKLFVYHLQFSKAENTVIAYLYDILLGVTFFKGEVFNITISDFRSFIAHRKRYKKGSQQRLISTWKSLLRYKNKRQLDLFHTPKISKPLPKPVSDEMVKAIMEMNEDSFYDLRDKVLWILMYSSGIRISEALSLKIDDIKNKTVLIRGKGNYERMVPITKYATDQLVRYIAFSSRVGLKVDFLFINHDNMRLSQQAASHRFRRWKNKMGFFDKCTLHSLRHGFASHVLRNGCPLTGIQKILGHKNLSTTTQYIKVENRYLEESFMQYIK